MKSIVSFQSFVKEVEAIRSRSKGPVWYRGAGESTHKLKPTLFRHHASKTLNDFEKLEKDITSKFKQQSIPFHERNLNDQWECLFFMQHYGVPTRLLDWTESPFVALYFAVMSAKYNKNGDGAKDAAIWFLRPSEWNAHALHQTGHKGGILSPYDPGLNAYSPQTAYDQMNALPAALSGTHNSQRIVVQRGVFTIFGQDLRPMEKMYKDDGFPSNILAGYILPKNKLAAMREAILEHGITESSIYPDLNGLALELRRIYGF